MVYEPTRVSLTRQAAKKAENIRDKVVTDAMARHNLEKEAKAAAKARQQDLQEACNRAESTNSRGEASTAADAKSSRVPGDEAVTPLLVRMPRQPPVNTHQLSKTTTMSLEVAIVKRKTSSPYHTFKSCSD